MNEIIENALLFDFYGELLTKHQRQVYEAVVMNDYSYSEVAEELGISRQGVHDLVKRSGNILHEYESKLHLVERFVRIRDKVDEIRQLAGNSEQESKESLIQKIEDISSDILEEL